jgi:hypothetical protein
MDVMNRKGRRVAGLQMAVGPLPYLSRRPVGAAKWHGSKVRPNTMPGSDDRGG